MLSPFYSVASGELFGANMTLLFLILLGMNRCSMKCERVGCVSINCVIN